ncbi:MAG TPA: M24 family metallopeptidase, partial [Chloroflexota bacterium]|nr:M24 family metallopeptidase [Chloroflexota bacterium]
GDVVSLLAAAEFQRYWAQAAQTYALEATEPAAAQRAAAAVDAMAGAARAGARVSTITEGAKAVLAGEDWSRAKTYGLGHGIGLDLEEAPAIAGASEVTLPPGTALALHVVLPGGIAGRTLIVAG